MDRTERAVYKLHARKRRCYFATADTTLNFVINFIYVHITSRNGQCQKQRGLGENQLEEDGTVDQKSEIALGRSNGKQMMSKAPYSFYRKNKEHGNGRLVKTLKVGTFCFFTIRTWIKQSSKMYITSVQHLHNNHHSLIIIIIK